MSTIKNGKYGDAERSRLKGYDHPEYGNAGPVMAPPRKSYYTKDEINNNADNESANYRRPVGDSDY